MKLSIITVTWNNELQIARQLKSVISGCKNISFEQIVVDNASKDRTVEIAKSVPNVKVIVNTENTGFAHANNQGMEISTGEYLLFLNADMKVEEGSIDTIVNWLENRKDVGIVSPKLVDENGKLNEDAKPRRLPRVWEQIALILKLPHLFPNILDKYLMKDFDSEKEQEVDSVRGSFMLMRRSVVEKLGFAFDPRYYIWYEDVDICREVKKMGLKVVYSPMISAIDYVGQSFKKQESLWKQKNFTRSMLTYFQKWEPFYKWMWIWLVRPVGIVMVYLVNKFNNSK
ncbi:MAG: glycosyltransferase family 2 protein [Candidatus Magasanikbacteria bacterium]